MKDTSHMKFIKAWGGTNNDGYNTYRLEGVKVVSAPYRIKESLGTYVSGSDGNQYGSVQPAASGYSIGDTIYIDRPSNPRSRYYNKPHLSNNPVKG